MMQLVFRIVWIGVMTIALVPGASGQGLMLRSPRTQEFTGISGMQLSGVLRMANESDAEQQLNLSLQDYRYHLDGTMHYEILPPGSLSSSMAPWVTLSAASIRFAPRETRVVPFSIRVPTDSLDAGTTYWALILLQPSVQSGGTIPTGDGGPGIRVVQRYRQTTLLAFHTRGKGVDDLMIDSVAVDTSAGPHTVSYRLQNFGSLGVRPKVTAEFYDAGGTLVAEADADVNETLLLPGSSFGGSIRPTNLPEGTYTVIVVADTGAVDLFGTQAQIQWSD